MLQTFLLQCTTLNKAVYDAIKSNQCFDEVYWRCNTCKLISTKPSTIELLNMFNELKTRVETLESQSGKSTLSKKSISAPDEKKKTIQNHVTHQVIVSIDPKEKLTEKTFADKVKANLHTVPVTGIKVINDGNQGIINFPDENCQTDGLSKLSNDFKAQPNNRPQRSLFPKVTIFGIRSSDYNNSDHKKLKQAISDKNPSLRTLFDQENSFEILFIKEDVRRDGSSFAAVKVNKEVYSAIRALKYQIYIDFSRCNISDRLRIIQCYRCQRFGHVSNNCSSPSQVCRYCTGCHDGRQCPIKSDSKKYSCINCKASHSSTYAKCPVLLSQVDSLVKRTQGMEDISKNDLRPSAIIT